MCSKKLKIYGSLLFLIATINLKAQNVYSIKDSEILKNGVSWEFVGTDNMAIFSLPHNYSTQQSMGMDIVRECIDLKLTSNEDLESIVASARDQGQVLILAGFWYDNDALPNGSIPYPECQLLGANPQEDSRWNAVMSRWQEIVSLTSIKNKSDVWINPWNEPYYWDGSHGYTDQIWETDAKAMIDTIRNTGANNIVLIEGSHMGQGHNVIIERGKNVRNGRDNILFDIHAYNSKWNITSDSLQSRIQALREAGNAIIFGEFANNGDEVWQNVMEACRAERVSLLAWLWGQYKEPFASGFSDYCKAERNNQGSNEINIGEAQSSDINIFPNPFQDSFTIETNENNSTQIEIYNLFGKIEYSYIIADQDKKTISLPNLNPGVYLINLTIEEKIFTRKILKQY